MGAGSDHGRTQTLLLVSKLLDCHQGLSPFTLLVDSLEQSAKPLIQDFIARAARTKTHTIFVSFETFRPPRGIKTFVPAHALSLPSLTRELQTQIRAAAPTKTLILIDTLHPLLSNPLVSPPAFLLDLITPSTTVVAVHHVDQPLAPSTHPVDPYSPSPAKLTAFLATSILTLHALPHVLAAESARQRSLPAPAAGLREAAEGAMRGVQSKSGIGIGTMVIEMEHRRRSGRSVGALFVLRHGGVRLLDEDPAWLAAAGGLDADRDRSDEATRDGELSFSLGLTEKQRRDREGVVLPYFDAQRDDGGAGQGGRILYDMGAEDDFDEEEDEI